MNENEFSTPTSQEILLRDGRKYKVYHNDFDGYFIIDNLKKLRYEKDNYEHSDLEVRKNQNYYQACSVFVDNVFDDQLTLQYFRNTKKAISLNLNNNFDISPYSIQEMENFKERKFKKDSVDSLNIQQKQIQLKDHQIDSLNHFAHQIKTNDQRRFLLGFKMGLGKTYCSLIHFKNHNIKKFIIVAKSKLALQWKKNVYEIFGKIDCKIYDKPNDEKLLHKHYFYQQTGVFIVSYERFKKFLDKIDTSNKITKKYQMFYQKYNVILDESQVLKHYNSQITKIFMKHKEVFNHLLLLSGSVISNEPNQLWAQYGLLYNDYDSYYNFAKTYFKMQKVRVSKTVEVTQFEGTNQNFEKLVERLHQVSYFKDNKDVLECGIEYIKHSVDKTQSKEIISNLRKIIAQGVYGDVDNRFISVFNTPASKYKKLFQLLSGYLYGYEVDDVNQFIKNPDFLEQLQKFDNDEVIIESNIFDFSKYLKKVQYLSFFTQKQQLLQNLLNNKNYLIFYEENAELDVIKKVVEKQNYNYFVVNGDVKNYDGMFLFLEQQKDDDKYVVIAQSKAAAQGLDGLQKYLNEIIWYRLPFSHETWEQANARLYRQNQQENEVYVHMLITSNFEQSVLNALESAKSYKEAIFNKDLSVILVQEQY